MEPTSVLRIVLITGACLAVALAGCGPDQGGTTKPASTAPSDRTLTLEDIWPPRAIWVVRETYDSPDEIAALMDEIHKAGLNTVLFQVRGNGTAWYRSEIEPFAYEYKNGDPGFDPLEIACREAHRRGLAMHAWVNVMPAWKDITNQGRPPSDPNQLYHTHPEWFWYDQDGRREPIPKGFYVSLNPCLPEVREYLTGVFEEIATQYPVDGLHLDYIRFPTDLKAKDRDYPHDEATLALFRKATGKTPAEDPAAWKRWRTRQVTQLVRDIRQMLGRVRPKAVLSAACAPDIAKAREHYYQDALSWIRGGLVDTLFVMNYTLKSDLFRDRHLTWQKSANGRPIVAGIGVYMHDDPQLTIEQLELAEQWGQGFCLFSDKSLFDGPPEKWQHLEAIRPQLLKMKRSALVRAEAGEDRGGIRARIGVTGAVSFRSHDGRSRRPIAP